MLCRLEHIEVEVDLPPDDPLFENHFPSNPMLPASLLIESFAQAGSILLETSFAFTRKAIPGYIVNAKFRRPVRPPAPVVIQLHVTQEGEDGAVLTGRAVQGKSLAGSCTLGMILSPIEGFYGPEHGGAYRRVYAELLEGAELLGFEASPLESLRHAIAG